MMTVQQIIERMEAEIVEDAKIRRVPYSVRAFADLHRYVDPNTYGGAEELFGAVVTESNSDHEHQAKLDIVNGLLEPAIKAVDKWLSDGGIERSIASQRIAVWRPKTMIGLGAPVAYLGDDHPPKGDWHQSAKSYLLDEDPHLRLHQMGRDFLIYSMYHARDPYHLGLAVENFGIACEKLGCTLPLKENEAVWLTYGVSELDPAPADEQQLLLRQVARVFGDQAATDQAAVWGTQWTSRTSAKPGGRHQR